jgi:hypothetical protein
MRRKALIALASVLVLGVVWVWPAFSEPARQPCDEGTWGYSVLGRHWKCTDWNVRFGQYGLPGTG